MLVKLMQARRDVNPGNRYEHLVVMLPYLIHKHVITATPHSYLMDPMTMLRPTIPYHCSSSGMKNVLCLQILSHFFI